MSGANPDGYLRQLRSHARLLKIRINSQYSTSVRNSHAYQETLRMYREIAMKIKAIEAELAE